MLIYSTTWVYEEAPTRRRTVVGEFQDADLVYKSLLEVSKVGHEDDRLRGRRLLWIRVDAVGSWGPPILGTDWSGTNYSEGGSRADETI